MPATHRKAAEGSSLLDSLNARADRSRVVDNFASITTYYRRADLLLRQVLQLRPALAAAPAVAAGGSAGCRAPCGLCTTKPFTRSLSVQADVYRHRDNENELYVMLMRFVT